MPVSAPGIVVLGGINMDLVTYSERFPSPGETVVGRRFLTYAGGKGANQAVAAARMGGRTQDGGPSGQTTCSVRTVAGRFAGLPASTSPGSQ